MSQGQGVKPFPDTYNFNAQHQQITGLSRISTCVYVPHNQLIANEQWIACTCCLIIRGTARLLHVPGGGGDK